MSRVRIFIAVAFLAANFAHGDDSKTKTLTLSVSETAGLRRFGYPVHVILPNKDGAITQNRIRLLEGGKPVPAQFRPFSSFISLGKKVVALDFNISIGPLESKTYTVEHGPDVTAGPEPKGGVTVEESGDAITVRSGTITYVVRRDLKGLLDEVRIGKVNYLKANSAGLLLDDKPVLGNADAKVEVAYKGPITTELRFTRYLGDRQSRSPGSMIFVEMTFPRSKSWVECQVQIIGKHKDFKSVGASLNLETETKPTLVDFGAGSTIYTTLGTNEAARLTGRSKIRPAWEIHTGKLPGLAPFALPHYKQASIPAEGWAHLMDNKRCTALAIEKFGKALGDDTILAEADGKLTWTRSDLGNNSSFRFWLHFVSMPVQVGALTSPQSMLAPLAVEIK